MEHDHSPLLGLQSTEPPLQLFPIGDGTGVVPDRCIDRDGSHLLRPAPPLPALVCAGVDHQAVEPGIEPIRIAQRGKLLPRANESFLHRILRQPLVPEDQASDRVQAIAGRGREDFECPVVPASCSLDEIAPHTPSITSPVSMTRAVRYDGSRGPGCSNNGRRRWYESGEYDQVRALCTDDGIVTTAWNTIGLYYGDTAESGTCDVNGSEFKRLARVHGGEDMTVLGTPIEVGDNTVAFGWEWSSGVSGTGLLHLRDGKIVVAVVNPSQAPIPRMGIWRFPAGKRTATNACTAIALVEIDLVEPRLDVGEWRVGPSCSGAPGGPRALTSNHHGRPAPGPMDRARARGSGDARVRRR